MSVSLLLQVEGGSSVILGTKRADRIYCTHTRRKWLGKGHVGQKNRGRHRKKPRDKFDTFGLTSTFGGDAIFNPISLIRTIFIISLDSGASFGEASFFDILTSIATARAAVLTVFKPKIGSIQFWETAPDFTLMAG